MFYFIIFIDIVELESCNNVAEPDETERGYVVVRLISATRGNVIAGLDEGIRTMTLGETSKIKIRYDYAYASYYMGSSIPPRANIVFTVNLLQINGSGRLGMPIRQVKRYAEKVYKLFLRTRKKIRITNRYFKKHQPIYTFYRKAKAILTCEKVYKYIFKYYTNIIYINLLLLLFLLFTY